jgi:hypothetical protein
MPCFCICLAAAPRSVSVAAAAVAAAAAAAAAAAPNSAIMLLLLLPPTVPSLTLLLLLHEEICVHLPAIVTLVEPHLKAVDHINTAAVLHPEEAAHDCGGRGTLLTICLETGEVVADIDQHQLQGV